MRIEAPTELVRICDLELSNYVSISFTKYTAAHKTLYFAEHFDIKKSEDKIWEEARNIHPAPTRITIEGALFLHAKKAGILVAQLPDEKKSNDELIADACILAVGKYIQKILSQQLQERKI